MRVGKVAVAVENDFESEHIHSLLSVGSVGDDIDNLHIERIS